MGLMVMCFGALPMTSFAEAPVNINLATAESLAEALEGVGLAKATRIIEYREAYGPFEQIEELASVQGIGQATIDKNRDAIRLQ
jgi:competence protein ComEA